MNFKSPFFTFIFCFSFLFSVAQNEDLLAKEKWKTSQQLDLNTKEFVPVSGGLYQFLAVYKPLHN